MRKSCSPPPITLVVVCVLLNMIDGFDVVVMAFTASSVTATGVGLVLLAHAPVEVQEEVLTGPVERNTSLTVTDPRELRAMLADVRANGFSVSDRQVTEDAVSVAAPVHDGRGDVVAAVSLVVRYGSAGPHALAPLVRTSARAISRALA